MMLPNVTSRGEIFVMDDDAALREQLSAALQEEGYDVICFADGAALLSLARSRTAVCVFLEVCMPDRSGLDILKRLRAEDCPAPIFVTSAQGDIAMAVDAIKCGAFDFIEKPFQMRDIIARVDAAVEKPTDPKGEADMTGMLVHLPGREPLTRREREVLARIAVGETSKEAARQLGLSSRTIESYRARIMKKVGVRNAAELLRRVLGQGRIL